MKKVISMILVMVMFGCLCLAGCASSGGDDLDMVNSYMENDSTVVVTFRNETGKQITSASGKLYLYTGSSANQNAIKSPSFSWSGTCQKGSTFQVTVNVSGAPAGLADQVNRIGFMVYEVN